MVVYIHAKENSLIYRLVNKNMQSAYVDGAMAREHYMKLIDPYVFDQVDDKAMKRKFKEVLQKQVPNYTNLQSFGYSSEIYKEGNENNLALKLLTKGTNVAQLIILLTTVPQKYFNHPLFVVTSLSDLDPNLNGDGFWMQYQRLQALIHADMLDEILGGLYSDISMYEHKYNLEERDGELWAWKQPYLRWTMYNSTVPANLKMNSEKYAYYFNNIIAKLRRGLWGTGTDTNETESSDKVFSPLRARYQRLFFKIELVRRLLGSFKAIPREVEISATE